MCDVEGIFTNEFQGRGRVQFEQFLKIANN
jgi:hypothetical protein